MRYKVLLACLGISAVLTVPALTQNRETSAKPQSERQKRRAEERLRKELESPYKKWLNEEVVWIISDEERKTFSRLETDDERQAFIEDFWLRRDPTPDTEENEFREEHYRRIAWANDRFASGIPGWKTDRGMIYIKFGPPDEREEHPTGGPYQRPIEEGGGSTTVFPFERWRYRYLDGVGQDINIEFVDKSMTNEYRLTWDPSEKDALLRVPGAGLTLYEQLGLANKVDRFNNGTGMQLGVGPASGTSKLNVFDRIQQYVNLQKAPGIKFKDLEALVNSTIKYNLLPMIARVDYIPVTESSVITNVTLQFARADLQYKTEAGVARSAINVHMAVTSITRKPVMRPVEEVLEVKIPAEMLGQALSGAHVYQAPLFLAPGRYRLSIAAKDVIGENQTVQEIALDVPHLQEDELATSSLILADVLEKVPTRNTGSGMFVIGTSKVRPKMDATFKQGDTIGIYLQVYNFEPNQNNKPEGEITYQIIKNGSNEKVFEFAEDISSISSSGASQVVIEKRLKLETLGLGPGDYTLQMKVTDTRRNESLTPTAQFKVL